MLQHIVLSLMSSTIYNVPQLGYGHSINNSTGSYFQYDGFTSRLGLWKTKGCSHNCTGYVFYEHLQFTTFLQVLYKQK